VLFLAFYQVVFGKFALAALKEMYTNNAAEFALSFKNILNALSGIFFDRDYGIFTYNPLYIVFAWGIMLVIVKKDYKKLLPALLVLPYFMMYLTYRWSGMMTPGRQMIPIILAGGFYIAYFIKETDFLNTKMFKILVGMAACISAVLMIMPALRYTSGREKIYTIIENSKFNFLWLLPDFNDIITFADSIVLLYLAVIAALFFYYTGIRVKDKE